MAQTEEFTYRLDRVMATTRPVAWSGEGSGQWEMLESTQGDGLLCVKKAHCSALTAMKSSDLMQKDNRR